jgi:hypothetical protein
VKFADLIGGPQARRRQCGRFAFPLPWQCAASTLSTAGYPFTAPEYTQSLSEGTLAVHLANNLRSVA